MRSFVGARVIEDLNGSKRSGGWASRSSGA
jgi:hypothetical protein